MTIANVALTNTFDEWRTRTNQVITFVNDFEAINLRATSEKTNIAFQQSNTIYGVANIAYAQANTGRDHANLAFEQANTARTNANVVFSTSNSYYITVFTHANAAHVQANTARTHANLAFDKANNAITDFSPASIQANTARNHANVAYEQANTGRNHANVVFTQANTARGHANVSFAQANTGRDHANVAFGASNTYYVTTFAQANTARVHANLAFGNANVAYDQANTARNHANAAFFKANTAVTDYSPALIQANTARDHANSAYAKANTIGTLGTQSSGSVSISGGTITGIGTLQAGSFAVSGDTTNRFQQGTAILRGSSPTFYFRDTDGNCAMLHNNSNLFYLLRGGVDTESWATVNGYWPWYCDLTNNNMVVGGAFSAVGDITAYYSDERLKTDIVPIKDALFKINQITGITYRNNELAGTFGFETENTHIGVLAQDVEKIAPEIVTLAPFDKDEHTGESRSGENYKTVKYDKIVPLLIEAVKELSERVNQLETQLLELKN